MACLPTFALPTSASLASNLIAVHHSPYDILANSSSRDSEHDSTHYQEHIFRIHQQTRISKAMVAATPSQVPIYSAQQRRARWRIARSHINKAATNGTVQWDCSRHERSATGSINPNSHQTAFTYSLGPPSHSPTKAGLGRHTGRQCVARCQRQHTFTPTHGWCLVLEVRH